MITLALAGKPNCGKSTFFKAATMAHAEIANYPFTTIDANFGVGYVRAVCPCRGLDLTCQACSGGIRYVAVNLIDVAGLVPEAHKGKGLGNQFLDHLRQADAIIHVIDASGGTDSEGNSVEPGSHDPLGDIQFLEYEMAMWVYGILEKHWQKISRSAQSKTYPIEKGVAEALAGLGIREHDITAAETATGIPLVKCQGETLVTFCHHLITISKPMLHIGNKVDETSDALIKRLSDADIHFVSAASELALRNAAAGQLITYHPGDPSFTIAKEETLSPGQKAGLARIKALMERFDGTGVQQTINKMVFGELDMIVVYPVEDENHFTDGKGRVLPDAFLMKKGSTPHDLAFQVHTDIGKGFLYAIDARKKMRIRESHVLADGDIIKIVSTAK